MPVVQAQRVLLKHGKSSYAQQGGIISTIMWESQILSEDQCLLFNPLACFAGPSSGQD